MESILKSKKLDNVCYDIRGPVLAHAKKMEDDGHRIIKLNIGKNNREIYNIIGETYEYIFHK